jgi:hypothetical protein
MKQLKKSLIILLLVVSFFVFNNKVNASTVFSWSFAGGTVSISDTGVFTYTGVSNIVLQVTGQSLTAGGGITGEYPYDKLSNTLYGNYGAGIYSGWVCFSASGGGTDTCNNNSALQYNFTDINVYGPDSIYFNSPILVGVYGSYVPFIGSYNNANGTYNKLIITIHNNTSTVADAVITLDAQTGSQVAFRADMLLLLNSNYTYSAKLKNSSTQAETTSTADITFNTGVAVILPSQPPTLDYQNCSITEIGGCLTNAFIYLAYPSDLAVDKLYDLENTIKDKPPIGYISGVFTILGNLSATETPTLTFASFTPLNTYIFSPIRSGLVFVLWIAFAFVLFKRFQHFNL